LLSLTLDTAAHKEYYEACETINDLRTKIQTQEHMLLKSRSMAITSYAFSTVGLFTFFAIELIPVVGTITTITTLVTYSISVGLALDIKKKLQNVRKNLELLNVHNREMEEVMERIRAQQKWTNE